jgi:FkbM family methyltransferase
MGAEIQVDRVGKSAFWVELTQELMRSVSNWYGADNWDADRFGSHKSSLRNWLMTKLNEVFRGKISIVPGDIEHKIQLVVGLQDDMEGLSAFYDLLEDVYSKSILIKLIAYRLMGYRKVKLPLNSLAGAYESNRQLVGSLVKSRDTIRIDFMGWSLNHFGLDKIGYPVECYSVPGGILTIFILKQYEYCKHSTEIKAHPGDCIIDAGGCWGDTALYFAHAVGGEGKVYTFEFVPDNLEVFQRNRSLNPQLAERIQIIPLALWNKSGESIDYSADGPGTTLTIRQGPTRSVSTVTIDDFVKQESLSRVDFIKMDIEGSELKALQGAEKTLRTFRPRLAIAVYHQLDDLITIPDYLNELGLHYEFFLDHFTIYQEESILFANPAAFQE